MDLDVWQLKTFRISVWVWVLGVPAHLLSGLRASHRTSRFWGVIEYTGQQRCMPCCRVQSTFLLLAGTGSDPSPGLMCQNSLEARNPKPRGFEGGEFLAWRFVISVSPRPWSVFIGSQKPQPQTFKKEKRGPGKES